MVGSARRIPAVGYLAAALALLSCSPGEAPRRDASGDRPAALSGRPPSPVADTAGVAPALLPGAFAFADSAGARLITVAGPTLADAGRLTRAACGGNVVLEVTYVERREASAASSGRDVAWNFDQLGGYVFRATGGRAAPDRTCLLLDSIYLSQWGISRSVAAGDSTCPAELLERLARASGGRPVNRCRHLVELSGGRQVAVVQFEGQGKHALASLVWAAPEVLAFADFPGSDVEGSTWRVDDDGVFDTGAFDVICVLESAGGVSLAYTWAGFEGESIALVTVEGHRLRPVLEAYRYWSPA